MREKPLLPWVIADASGNVLAGHCNCMAGLGESCSHVASLLWAVEAGVRLRDSVTVTQKRAYWVLPASVKEVPYAPLSHINLHDKSASLAVLRSPQLLSPTSATPLSSGSSNLTRKRISPPSSEEVKSFFTSLSACSTKPGILAFVKDL